MGWAFLVFSVVGVGCCVASVLIKLEVFSDYKKNKQQKG